MQYRRATVELNQADIAAAIRDYLRPQGYRPGEVRLVSTPHQRNGPDTFSAVVEVDQVPGTTEAKEPTQIGPLLPDNTKWRCPYCPYFTSESFLAEDRPICPSCHEHRGRRQELIEVLPA